MEQIRDFETFEPSQIITPDDYPLPKEGHIGYVKFENPQEYATLNPTWTDVDSYQRKADGGTRFTFNLNL